MENETPDSAPPIATILVIDDCAILANSLSAGLRERRFRVLQASDGNTGINVCRNEKVDVALVDIVMPEKEGIGTIRELRQSYPSIGILAMSGANPLYLDNALVLGADGAISKPFRMEKLLQEIGRILRKK